MNRKGFTISIPQMITAIISMFIVILGMRIFSPIIFTFLDLGWKDMTTYWVLKIVIYLIAFFLVYFIAYSSMYGKKPNVLNEKTERREFE